MPHPESSQYHTEQNPFTAGIRQIETLGKSMQVDIRFVGGAVTDAFLSANTIDFDILNHTIIVDGPLPSLYRADHTVKDLDIIAFCPNKLLYDSFVRTALHTATNHTEFPQVSIEPAIYDTWPTTHNIKFPQMVSTIEVKNETPYLRFGSLWQQVHPDSFHPWTLTLANGVSYPILNPLAHVLRYFMRNPSSIKQKDRGAKITRLFDIANQTIGAEATATNEWEVNKRYRALFEPWIQFVEKLLTSTNPDIAVKRTLTQWYWSHIGTALAHSKLNELGNKFTG